MGVTSQLGGCEGFLGRCRKSRLRFITNISAWWRRHHTTNYLSTDIYPLQGSGIAVPSHALR